MMLPVAQVPSWSVLAVLCGVMGWLGVLPVALAGTPDMPRPFQLAQGQPPRDSLTDVDAILVQGVEQYDRGQFEAALKSLQQALVLYRQLGNRQREGMALGNLGLVYEALGDPDQAIAYQQQRLMIARSMDDRSSEAAVLVNLGQVYHGLGNYAQAIAYHQQSLTIARQINSQRVTEAALGNLGATYAALGEFEKAVAVQEQSLAIARTTGNRLVAANALGNLANIYYRLENFEQALDLYQQRLDLAQTLNDRPGEAITLTNLGRVYTALGQYGRALEYQQQSLAIARQMQSPLAEADVLNAMGNTYYQMGDYAKAANYHRQRLTISRAIQDRRGVGISLNNLGLVLFHLGQLPEAEQRLREAIQVYESQRLALSDRQRVSLSDIQRNAYINLQEVLIAQNKVEAALEISERGRARALAELLVQRTQTQPQLPPIQIEAIQQLARAQQVTLVEYASIADEQLFIWVVQPTGLVHFRRVDLQPLQAQKTSLKNLVLQARCLGDSACTTAIAARGAQRIVFNAEAGDRQVSSLAATLPPDPALQHLHQLLIAPIADLLPTDPDNPVVLVPQGDLFLLPFALLQDPQGQYLLERHTLSIIPSIQVLQLTGQLAQRRSRSQGDMLLVGNPTMPRITYRPGEPAVQLAALPGAEAEVNAIAQLFNHAPLIGAQATETAVRQRLSTARLVHLATHGLLDDLGQSGVPGAIALATDRQHDGLLTANELLELQLQAELVVLSACDTGRGRITGDGVIGLSRSLITAGVPRVIVSLWAVPDAPTAELMTAFYQNVRQGQSQVQALRRAMLATKAQYPNPVAWAGFTLIGAPW